MTDRAGGCMCGAIRFRIADAPTRYGVCNCETCRRWTGSALLGMTVPRDRIAWEQGADKIARRKTSDWAERAWCGDCGSTLYYHLTLPDQDQNYEMSVGLFDDVSGLEMGRELFTDCRISGATYEGAATRDGLTRADVFAMFGS